MSLSLWGHSAHPHVLGDAEVPLFAVRYDLGVASDYSYFAPARNFLLLYELFEAYFVVRQRKTAIVSIEFSKEVKYSIRKEENRPKQGIYDETYSKEASKKLKARQKQFACGAIGRQKIPPAAK